MLKNNRRRLSIHDQRNRLLIGLVCIIIIAIYFTINPVKYNRDETDLSEGNSSTVYLCPQLSSTPKIFFHIDFTQNFSVNYTAICRPDHLLLIYVLSTSKNYERRNAIRHTWANKNAYPQLDLICFVFIVGLSTNTSDLPYYGDLRKEGHFHQDIVQLDLKESYENVAYKEVGALKWSHVYASHVPYLFKTDDDLIIDTLLLADVAKFLVTNQTDHSLYFQKYTQMQTFIQSVHKVDKYTLFKGLFLGGLQTLRSGKFGVHEFAWNHDRLPPYCSGFGFLYSSFIRDRLYRASLCYASEHVPLVGDVFVSGFLAGTASVQCSGWSLGYMQTYEPCSPHFHNDPRLLVCSTPFHGGRIAYGEYDITWQFIVARHPATAHLARTIALTTTTTTTLSTSSIHETSSITTDSLTKNFTEQHARKKSRSIAFIKSFTTNLTKTEK